MLDLSAVPIKQPIAALLPPNPRLQSQSDVLRRRIVEEIQQSKTNSISFSRFMELALYEPCLGYYTAALPKLGEEGDFITAPEISPFFAQVLGQQCQQVFLNLGEGEIMEIGAGTGKLSLELLRFLEQSRALPTRYRIVEISPCLRQRQKFLIKKYIPHLYHLLEWSDSWPVKPIKGVVIANEVIDAFPVHRFLWTQANVQEMCVTATPLGKFNWHLMPLESCKLTKKLHQLQFRYFDTAERYESEICVGLLDWITALAGIMDQGLALIIDYGYSEREYYHSERCQGTLMCYRQHRAYTNPFTWVGLQDITVSVDFSWLAHCAVRAGLTVAGFTSQAAFLINNGLLELLKKCYNGDLPMNVSRQIWRLTSPNAMGELVKVIGLTRGYASAIQGFSQYDRRSRL